MEIVGQDLTEAVVDLVVSDKQREKFRHFQTAGTQEQAVTLVSSFAMDP